MPWMLLPDFVLKTPSPLALSESKVPEKLYPFSKVSTPFPFF